MKVLVQAHIINSVDSLDTSSCYGKMFCVKRHAEKRRVVSAALPTKPNLTTTTIAISRNTNYFKRFNVDLIEANVVNV